VLLSLQFLAAAASEKDGMGCSANNGECPNQVDYLIVGAGGSGIQTALLLKKYGYSFQILEREETAASFWTTFPRFQELISVNKNVQNETQRFRYDWHSMLDAPIKMWDISKDYFPTGRDWRK
jgi:cation diffusion facilitator CzcD-associated flavoprotein CzcO